MPKSKVFFTKNVSPEALLDAYSALQISLPGKLAVKLHSGEDGNQNYVRPEFVRPIIDSLGGTVVECNTAYGDIAGGVRDHTEGHLKLIEKHGWNKYFKVDLMDAEGPDLVVPIKNGRHLKENLLGKNIRNYDSMLVLSHFKGHPAGGYGGALKQISIGCASSRGKALIHSAGQSDDNIECWQVETPHDFFLESMVDAASTIIEMFGKNLAYINMMINLSVDCDCSVIAEDPCMADIGILGSLDPVAIDQACMDLIETSDDPGRDHFMERVDSMNGKHTIEVAEAAGLGSRDYELIEI